MTPETAGPAAQIGPDGEIIRPMRSGSSRPSDSGEGFSLIEALVGLTLIAVALLLSMSLLAQQPGVERRLAAHHEALLAAKSQLESLRSSLVLPADGELVGLPAAEAAAGLRMWIDVEARPERSLYEVELLIRYAVGAKSYDLRLRSMIFTP
jgi:hypothetical protein